MVIGHGLAPIDQGKTGQGKTRIDSVNLAEEFSGCVVLGSCGGLRRRRAGIEKRASPTPGDCARAPTIRPWSGEWAETETRKTFRMASLLPLALQSNTKGEARGYC
jgi:hypothetical protein